MRVKKICQMPDGSFEKRLLNLSWSDVVLDEDVGVAQSLEYELKRNLVVTGCASPSKSSVGKEEAGATA